MSASPLIFICYSGPDRHIAEHVHRALNNCGMRPWCDAVDLVPGEKWDEAIPRVLKQAAALLVLVTNRWPLGGDESTSWYGPEEVALAIDHARRVDPQMAIVPARLDGADPQRLPYGLRRLVEIEATAADPAPIVAGLTLAFERRARALTSPEAPVLNQQLADAKRRIRTLEAKGVEGSELEAAIAAKLAIKRNLRAGGQLRAGDELDRYVLAECIGHGGFASVWRAWDPTQGDHVAVKVLHARWNHDASKVERFRRGINQMARLKHPAVVPVLDADREDNGWYFFVMAWMPGGDLCKAITRADAPLSADEGLQAVLEIADALAVAHARGVVHRDVKPRNILLDTNGRAKLSDFDLVKALDTSGGTGTGAMGTFLYAAPEQLDRPQDVGPRADVYALGMTAVFVITGRQPETMTKWRPGAAVARLPANPAVRACLLRAIALDETDRPGNATAFAAELRAARTGVATDIRALAEFVLPVADRLSIRDDTHTEQGCEAQPATAHRPAMVLAPPGEFTMGSPVDEPGRLADEQTHQAKLTRAFLMAETEVTQAQYAALMGENPAYFQGTEADGERPVEQVSWLDAVKYCNALSRVEGLDAAYFVQGSAVTWNRDAVGYRLPTEAEWEYAARAGTATATYAGDLTIQSDLDASELDSIAWYGGNSKSTHSKGSKLIYGGGAPTPLEKIATQPVGGKRPNGWGLYDMLGNVWEWTWDRYATDYEQDSMGAAIANPAGPIDGALHVFRGGSVDAMARRVRAAVRDRGHPGYQSRWLGFRPVRTAARPAPTLLPTQFRAHALNHQWVGGRGVGRPQGFA